MTHFHSPAAIDLPAIAQLFEGDSEALLSVGTLTISWILQGMVNLISPGLLWVLWMNFGACCAKYYIKHARAYLCGAVR